MLKPLGALCLSVLLLSPPRAEAETLFEPIVKFVASMEADLPISTKTTKLGPFSVEFANIEGFAEDLQRLQELGANEVTFDGVMLSLQFASAGGDGPSFMSLVYPRAGETGLFDLRFSEMSFGEYHNPDFFPKDLSPLVETGKALIAALAGPGCTSLPIVTEEVIRKVVPKRFQEEALEDRSKILAKQQDTCDELQKELEMLGWEGDWSMQLTAFLIQHRKDGEVAAMQGVEIRWTEGVPTLQLESLDFSEDANQAERPAGEQAYEGYEGYENYEAYEGYEPQEQPIPAPKTFGPPPRKFQKIRPKLTK